MTSYDVLNRSTIPVEATASYGSVRVVFKGELTFEKVLSSKYGVQLVIALWMQDLPKFEFRQAQNYSRIEICLPLKIAEDMRLI